MSGPQFAERLRALRPATRVLFMSGYADDTVLAFGAVDVNRSLPAEAVHAGVARLEGARRARRAGVASEEHDDGRPGQADFFCGKMAAGKSTLSKALAGQEQAILLVQDEWLSHLFPGEILDIPDYVRCSARLERRPDAARHGTAVERHLGRARLSRATPRSSARGSASCSRPLASSTIALHRRARRRLQASAARTERRTPCRHAVDDRGRVRRHHVVLSAPDGRRGASPSSGYERR
jgi:hypothetical protein